MKKIDLHIHTYKSISDSVFEFDIEKLKSYIEHLQIDCIAITNHNLFDKEQFLTISEGVEIDVLPGVEVDLEGGHLLIITDADDLQDFSNRCKLLKECIKTDTDSITIEKLKEIYTNLDKYLLIPHYEKSPILKPEVIERLGIPIYCGEVGSIKKFRKCLKDKTLLVPVLFSDIRIDKNMVKYSNRQTFVDIETLSISSLKSCLSDRSKVFLTSREDGNGYFQADNHGLHLSTGLNVIIGERSSGKTYTLDNIYSSHENVKYIKQFSLLQNDEEKFEELLSIRQSTVSEEYLKQFKEVVSEISNIDIYENERQLENYLSTLIEYANHAEEDSFSKAVLFSETPFVLENLESLNTLISSTKNLIDSTQFKDIIEKHIDKAALVSLIIDLMELYTVKYQENKKKQWINSLIVNIQEDLRFRTTTTYIEDHDFYNHMIENQKVNKFIDLARELKKERVISSKPIRNFKVTAETKKFSGAGQLKAQSRRRNTAFSDAYDKYYKEYEFLQELKKIEIEETEYYKYFIDFEYKTLNKDGFKVSGGERSEFNLLHEINDALKYEILLIDEPESSFDNIFLKKQVNELIKDISKEIPVVVVTHNNTVGASIKPSFLICTKKVNDNNEIKYKVYSGLPYSKKLVSVDGDETNNYQITLDCLEAGNDAYIDRRTNSYEILKD